MTGYAGHKFHTLDAMRGVAALAVVLFHFRRMFPLVLDRVEPFTSGYLAVDLFFALSGFVIAFAYDRRFAEGLGAGRFLVMRLVRLCPMIAVGVVVGAAFKLVNGTMPLGEVLWRGAANALVIPTFIAWNRNLFQLNGAEWSLFFELVANVAYAALFPFLARRGLIAVLVASGIAVIGYGYAYGRLQFGSTAETAPMALARVSFSFSLGVALMRSRDRWWNRVVALPTPLLLLVTFLAFQVPAPQAYRPTYDILFVMLASPALIVLGAKSTPAATMLPTAAWLGLISYPLYTFHQPVRDFAKLTVTNVRLSPTVVACAFILGCLAASWFLARTYDRSVRRWLSRLLRIEATGLSRTPDTGTLLKRPS